MGRPIPGLFLTVSEDNTWAESGEQVKRRHFVVEGQTLKLFGRRGKTYMGNVNLVNVVALKPATDPSAPPGSSLSGPRKQTWPPPSQAAGSVGAPSDAASSYAAHASTCERHSVTSEPYL